MTLRTLAAVLVLILPSQTRSDPAEVAESLAEARAFAAAAGDRLWPGYGTAPFGILLIEGDRETLFCQAPPSGFTSAGTDTATGCEMAHRPPSGLPDNLLAAMPLFGLPSTIVVGTPQSTHRAPEVWVRTLLHEHFHQWQMSLPGYFTRVAELDLSDGDQTGMWMLNFAAPYAEVSVIEAHAHAAAAMVRAIEARGGPGFVAALGDYLLARKAFERTMDVRSWRYLEFQFWQEGVARWTEIELGRHFPNTAVRKSADTLEQETLEALRRRDIASTGRLFAYAYGAGEAMLLEACDAGWKRDYAANLALAPRWEHAACLQPTG